MAPRQIVVIGASAGGVDALQKLCAGLPADFPASILIAQHLSASGRSILPRLISRVSALPVVSPEDGQALESGHIYVASPDLHILVRTDRVLMRKGPHENRSRPSVNALFRSAAVAYGAQVVGVVLTGLLDDGTEGLIAIRAAGGLSIVQDPDDAEWPSMPRNALKRDHVNYVAPLADIPALLSRVVREEAGPDIPLPEEFAVEDRMAAQEFSSMDTKLLTPGGPSHLSCPDCGGVLNQIDLNAEIRFRCQVGHAFTPLGLADAQTDELERALSIAARTHRDRIRLFDQMQDSARNRNLPHAEKRWIAASAESAALAEVLEAAMQTLQRAPSDGEG